MAAQTCCTIFAVAPRQALEEGGITIPLPQRDVHLHREAESGPGQVHDQG